MRSSLPPPPDDARLPASAAYLLGFASGAFVLWRHRDQPFARFHAWQSILFSGFVVAAAVALDLVPIVGLGMALVLVAASALVWAWLLVQAARGHWTLLPLLGDVALERARADRSPRP